MGEVPPEGTIRFKGTNIAGMPSYQIAHLGLGYVPETRDIFPGLTVRQNLMLGIKDPRNPGKWRLDDMLQMFPNLAARADTAAGVMSGGAIIAVASQIKGIITPSLLIYFGVYFLLGYVLYSTLCAAVGSMVNSEQEAQQMQFLVMMPMILSVIFIVNIFTHPNSQLAVFGSLFPFTAPLVMFSRIAMLATNPPPFWQIALSIALMIGTIYVMVWLCGRIYRVGILMYGKKPTLPEIVKWIKYA